MIDWKKLQNGSDIRGVAMVGVAGEETNLTPDVAYDLGRAFAAWLREQNPDCKKLKVALGIDSRLTGVCLKRAFADGLCRAGVLVYDCGLASTPAMFMTTITDSFLMTGAVMITASHLPFNRNGFKFFTNKGGLDKKDITEILTKASLHNFDSDITVGTVEDIDFMKVYANILAEKIKQGVNHPHNYQTPLKGLHIIVDAGNGSGGFYAKEVLETLGADITGSQFLDPDGYFPNHVPNPEDSVAMSSICEAVKMHKADLGIIFDTDVDRSAIVDRSGNAINRNELVALSSAIVLEEHPNTTIVTDSITSDGLSFFINEKLNGKHHRFQRGYKNVINEALRLNNENEPCWLAIETSGHAALKENYFLDDGAYLANKIVIKLAQMAAKGEHLNSLIDGLITPKHSLEIRINITNSSFFNYGSQVVNDLTLFCQGKSNFEIVKENYEGIRVRCTDESEKGWFLLRLSLHDPVLPLNIESDVNGGVTKIVAQLLEFFKQYDGLDIPSLKSQMA